MAKATLTLDQVRNFCVQCGEPIPLERIKSGNAVTCSTKCGQARERQKMLLLEQKECKYCRRPSTPAERESFKQWRKWVKDQAQLAAITEEVTAQPTEPTAAEVTAKAVEIQEYPYIYTRFNSSRKGQRCKMLSVPDRKGSNTATQVQIQFEDGETLIADKMNLSSGRPKKYSEKRGRPRKAESTLAAKQETEEGE